jgi:hypothetical protein
LEEAAGPRSPAPFALDNAETHAAAVNVGNFEMDHFARSQAGIVGDLQQRPVAQGLSRSNQLGLCTPFTQALQKQCASCCALHDGQMLLEGW